MNEFEPKRMAHRLEDERLGIRGAGVMVSTNMWFLWTRAAIGNERSAKYWSDAYVTRTADPSARERLRRNGG
jgi:hypothetical protein